eukprot:g5571.t1
MEQAIQTAHELGEASALLRHLCLHEAAAWTLEQSTALNTNYKDNTMAAITQSRRQIRSSFDTSDQFEMGRRFLTQNEYFRAADCFEKCTSAQAVFLKYYSKYLAAQKQKRSEDWVTQPDHLRLIRKELERRALTAGVDDAFIHYLYGLVSKGSQSGEALLKSVKLFYFNWSAWEALLEHVKNQVDLDNLIPKLPDHWMTKMFLVGAFLKLRMFQEGLDELKLLSERFPSSDFVLALLAEYHYYLGNHELSLGLFDQLGGVKSSRRKGMDLYSNLLYICGRKVELSILARRMLEYEKFTPEACCVIGNHYSMKRDSKKAIDFFQRASRLDENFLTAKLFMAQEYLETRQNKEAIKVIQEVLDEDENNYYAWHVLAQAYDMSEAYSVAAFAFQQ